MIFRFLYWFQIFKDQCGVFHPYLQLSLSYVAVHSVPSRLVWNRNQVYCTCCSAQTTHTLVLTGTAKKTTGTKSLLSQQYIYCDSFSSKHLGTHHHPVVLFLLTSNVQDSRVASSILIMTLICFISSSFISLFQEIQNRKLQDPYSQPGQIPKRS